MSDKLAGVHPDLVAKIHKIQQALAALGWLIIPTDGVRDAVTQHADWLKGRNAAGQVIDAKQIVTNADGYKALSKHQAHPDGFGHAVDCAFLDPQGRPSWDAHYPWSLYGAMGEALGLLWGGDASFRARGLVDQPHLELPEVPGAAGTI